MKVNILGAEYAITIKAFDEDETFAQRSIAGYCDSLSHEIVICDMSTYEGWENEGADTIEFSKKETIRHEIVHAFLGESGLMDCALSFDGPWANNEEMIDWIAIQGPKIYQAWKDADSI